ncbi:MAG TPA: TGS domain-containing protein, partial [Candidatus Eisenbacteria bacterium]|nr:TGS domain-containing protein [Candidatus Eisenbacteria bacterium]
TALEDLDDVHALLRAKHLELVPAGQLSEAGPPSEDMVPPTRKETLLVVTGVDRETAASNLSALRELLGWPIHSVSAVSREGLEELAQRTFEALDVIRVYTKEPGKPADREKPFTLKRGATVADLAGLIHRDLSSALRFARLWGTATFDGQPVKGDHVLLDGDVVELHV